MQTRAYDIIIIGGGMVGCALACALAQQTQLSIAVLESQPSSPDWSDSQYHHRVSAIALSSQRIFKSLGVWDAIQKKRVSPFSRIHVWDEQGGEELHFDSADIGEPSLGAIIENTVIQSSLQEKIKHYPHITLLYGITLTAFAETDKGVTVSSADGRHFNAKLAIAADGAHSWLREQAGMMVDKLDYDQQAIVAAVQTSLPHEQTARQVFLPTGPLAFLPLANETLSSIVWSLPTTEAKRLMAVDDASFKQALSHAFSQRLGEVVKIEKRFAFPLYKQQAKHYVKSRVVLTGDAAHTVHPLAGQGVNMGLLDAASLAQVLTEAIAARRDIAGVSSLRRYERWRKADNLAMLAGLDIIKTIFASDKKSVQQWRSQGLGLTNRLRWLKTTFMRHAVGERLGLPRLGEKRNCES